LQYAQSAINDIGLWKSLSQKLAQGLEELKTYINPTSNACVTDVGTKCYTLQLDLNNPPRSATIIPDGLTLAIG